MVKLTAGAPLLEFKVMVVLPLLVSLNVRLWPAAAFMNMPPVPDTMLAFALSGPSIVSGEPLGDWMVML